MRLIDRTPGCDASSVRHQVVLQLRPGRSFDPQEIAVTRVRRIPR